MKHVVMSRLLVLTALISTVADAGDIAAGKTSAVSCAACHGSAGVSANPEWPNLAGQKEKYLIKQLKGFRDGSRDSALMSPMAKSLSDDDIANISAYYASLK